MADAHPSTTNLSAVAQPTATAVAASPDGADRQAAALSQTTTSAPAVDDIESMSDEQLLKMLEESRIVIKKGGEVIIENLTPGLLEVAFELDPDNEGIQCRLEATRDTEETQPASSPNTTDPQRDA